VIFLIAIINYLFISNGTLTLRLKEFSVKNYFGFGECGIKKQIFCDSLILFIIAGITSVIILFELSSPISQLFKVDFLSLQLKKNILLLAIIIITISSITSFIQFVIFKRKIVIASVGGFFSQPFLSKKLVYISTLQFCISISLIASMIIVYMQLNFAMHKDLGFKVENVINISHGSIGAKQKMLKEEINKIPGVANASASLGIPGLETVANEYKPEGSEQMQIFSMLSVDENFFKTFGLEIVEGRNFRDGANSDTKEFIVNETLVKQMNWKNAIGKSMEGGGKHEIIGVVKDFHVGLIYSKIPPLIITKEWTESYYSLSIEILPGETHQTIEQIENSWKKLMPDVAFNYSFMSEKFESLYAEIKQIAIILLLFTGISILISVLGLFGITILLMNSKVKEIGIRKVNGATVFEIVKMLNYNLIKWVAIAFVIAVPISWYIMNRWLQNFAYKVDLSWWIFALAGFLALLIALITVSWQAFLAARRNPIEALRYE
jgi:putative ABC transport system permease protein